MAFLQRWFCHEANKLGHQWFHNPPVNAPERGVPYFTENVGLAAQQKDCDADGTLATNFNEPLRWSANASLKKTPPHSSRP
jgi:hypothetical protein